MLSKLRKLYKLKNIPELIQSRINLRKNKAYNSFLKKSYSVFAELSNKKNVTSVTFKNGESIIELMDGRKYYFNPFSKIDMLYSVPQSGTFEPDETEIVNNLVKKGDYCLDIGGSFGWYTVLLSKKIGNEGVVFSFEPIKQNYESHLKNIELNKCHNVNANNLAVGKEKGEIEIYLSDVDTSGSLKLRGYKSDYEVQNTKIIKLDDYFSENNIDKLDFIKIDIEGAELDALKGAENTLLRHMPILFVEIQRHSTELFGYKPYDIFNYLYGLGYESYIINNSALDIYEFKEPLEDYNFFFKRKIG